MKVTRFPPVQGCFGVKLSWPERFRGIFRGVVHINQRLQNRIEYQDASPNEGTIVTDSAFWSKGRPRPSELVSSGLVKPTEETNPAAVGYVKKEQP